MWYQNDVSKNLGIKYPIIQAGMAGGVTTPKLVASVSNSGGLGTIGAGYMSVADLNESIKQVKKQTNLPFGVNLFIPEVPEYSEEQVSQMQKLLTPFMKELNLFNDEAFSLEQIDLERQIESIIKERVPVCSFTFGIPPKEIMKELKKEGIKVIGTATTVKEALINQECGVDVIVAQGSEAGGHRGTFLGTYDESMIGTFSLIPQVVDAVEVPVIAAGGVMDGRGVIAALALGAKGVQMGTAFLTNKESGAKAIHKKAILQGEDTSTTITSAFSGKPARGMTNSFINIMKEYENQILPYPVQNALTKELRREAGNQHNPELMSLWSGQSPRLSKDVYVHELIDSLVQEVEKGIHRLTR
ncbi:nitronate monooxygenase [Rossellomorea sp. SC111]|uniref:NAD(P)H-dependent flavin oxidoreductase n=1 Tax=Rossellomorea sp. SC111 TaxID=2968985 RepID=UPI00215AD2FC|nr:nitronate monooxygenase [Rossellomorea sp. SC111]MCR8847468.1 nitronate monooxygenase [Rossellomorea sp. SC111]